MILPQKNKEKNGLHILELQKIAIQFTGIFQTSLLM